jgi:hypothetical protein
VEISPGWCECGCGGATTPAKQSDRARGLLKGRPARFVHGHHGRLVRRGSPALVAALALQEPRPPLPVVIPRPVEAPSGVRPEIHARFWSVVARAFEKNLLPPRVFRQDAEDEPANDA